MKKPKNPVAHFEQALKEVKSFHTEWLLVVEKAKENVPSAVISPYGWHALHERMNEAYAISCKVKGLISNAFWAIEDLSPIKTVKLLKQHMNMEFVHSHGLTTDGYVMKAYHKARRRITWTFLPSYLTAKQIAILDRLIDGKEIKTRARALDMLFKMVDKQLSAGPVSRPLGAEVRPPTT